MTTRAQQVWQEARKGDDFEAFRPWLEKIVALKTELCDGDGQAGKSCWRVTIIKRHDILTPSCQLPSTFRECSSVGPSA